MRKKIVHNKTTLILGIIQFIKKHPGYDFDEVKLEELILEKKYKIKELKEIYDSFEKLDFEKIAKVPDNCAFTLSKITVPNY